VKRTWQLTSTAEGATFDLRFGYGVHTLGSGAGSDLRVSHPTVSRSHARLTCTDDGITVEDLGSTNGTAVDGTPVDGPVVVADHAALKVGGVIFELGPLQTDDAENRLFGLFLALVSLGHVNFRGTSFWTRFGRRTAPLVFSGYAVAVMTLILVGV